MPSSVFLYYRKLRKINLAVLYNSDAKQTAIGEQPPAGVARFFRIFIDKYPLGVYNGIRRIPLGGMREVLMEKICECCGKTKIRDEKEYQALINRLNRIEGQVRGIKGMVENSAYCTDILMQVSAVSAALNAFNKELLANHIRTCVAQDIRDGKDETVDELVATLQRLMK